MEMLLRGDGCISAVVVVAAAAAVNVVVSAVVVNDCDRVLALEQLLCSDGSGYGVNAPVEARVLAITVLRLWR
ncbi:Hypothetical predicted protein [Octopus vulgaris]|uniref:Uncharacterized protein n=1 Tax=Octopus vulgaris TaxID=6645 RepID=A0AA36FEN4_OCTVU|nr:Hypothetical predicted protein [Octopus vulgaris]